MLLRLNQRLLPHLCPSRAPISHKILRSHSAGIPEVPKGLSVVPASVQVLGSADDVHPNHGHFFSTTKRWLWNEKQQLAARYKFFDVSALQRVACDVAGAKTCITMVKLAEGSFNKVFLLKFDNGEESIARIPCPSAGPERLIVSSEVATLDYARRYLHLTVPRVLAWSADGMDTGVGSGYIIMDKMPGVPLESRWLTIKKREVFDVMLTTVRMEKALYEVPFSQIGSLYFKEDVSDELKGRRLYAEGVPDDDASETYRIGPTVEYDFCRGERKNMDIDRGPWPDFYAYAKAVVERERQWLTSYASHCPSLPHRQHAPLEVYLKLLDDLLAIIPALQIPTNFTPPVLWHPDLHRENILVRENGSPDVTGFIDWQHAWVGPRFFQNVFSPAFHHDHIYLEPVDADVPPRLPDDFDAFSPEEQDDVRDELLKVSREYHYLQIIRHFDPERLPAVTSLLRRLVIGPFQHIPNIRDDGVDLVGYLLSQIFLSWDSEKLGRPDSSCPLSFSEEEIARLSDEIRRGQERDSMISMYAQNGDFNIDGGVVPEKYDSAKEYLEGIRGDWEASGMWGPWFAEDGAPSAMLY